MLKQLREDVQAFCERHGTTPFYLALDAGLRPQTIVYILKTQEKESQTSRKLRDFIAAVEAGKARLTDFTKTCLVCGRLFKASPRVKCCSPLCKKKRERELAKIAGKKRKENKQEIVMPCMSWECPYERAEFQVAWVAQFGDREAVRMPSRVLGF